MKVLLIKPADPCADAKYREYPLGLGYLAT